MTLLGLVKDREHISWQLLCLFLGFKTMQSTFLINVLLLHVAKPQQIVSSFPQSMLQWCLLVCSCFMSIKNTSLIIPVPLSSLSFCQLPVLLCPPSLSCFSTSAVDTWVTWFFLLSYKHRSCFGSNPFFYFSTPSSILLLYNFTMDLAVINEHSPRMSFLLIKCNNINKIH